MDLGELGLGAFLLDAAIRSLITAGVAAAFAPFLQYIYTFITPDKPIDILENCLIFASVGPLASAARIVTQMNWSSFILFYTLRISIGASLGIALYFIFQPKPTMINLTSFAAVAAFLGNFISYLVLPAIVHIFYSQS